MKTLLVIVFFVNGQPTTLDGWEPRNYLSEQECLTRRDKTIEYLSGVIGSRSIRTNEGTKTVDRELSVTCRFENEV